MYLASIKTDKGPSRLGTTTGRKGRILADLDQLDGGDMHPHYIGYARGRAGTIQAIRDIMAMYSSTDWDLRLTAAGRAAQDESRAGARGCYASDLG